MGLFGATPRTLPYAMQFMRIILVGVFFQYASFGLNAIIRAEGNPRLAMATQLINAGLNIVLDAVLIFGCGWGVVGAAVATVAAQAVSAVWTLAHFRSRRSLLKLRLANLRLRWEVVRPALAIGLAPCSMHLAGSVAILLVNRGLSQHGGDAAINAYGVICSLSMLALMPVFGINQGVQPIIGYNYGAGHVGRVLRALKLAVVAATAILTVGFIVAETIPAQLIRVFSPDSSLIAIGYARHAPVSARHASGRFSGGRELLPSDWQGQDLADPEPLAAGSRAHSAARHSAELARPNA